MTAKKRAIIAIATVFVIALAGAAGWWVSTKGLVGAEADLAPNQNISFNLSPTGSVNLDGWNSTQNGVDAGTCGTIVISNPKLEFTGAGDKRFHFTSTDNRYEGNSNSSVCDRDGQLVYDFKFFNANNQPVQLPGASNGDQSGRINDRNNWRTFNLVTPRNDSNVTAGTIIPATVKRMEIWLGNGNLTQLAYTADLSTFLISGNRSIQSITVTADAQNPRKAQAKITFSAGAQCDYRIRWASPNAQTDITGTMGGGTDVGTAQPSPFTYPDSLGNGPFTIVAAGNGSTRPCQGEAQTTFTIGGGQPPTSPQAFPSELGSNFFGFADSVPADGRATYESQHTITQGQSTNVGVLFSGANALGTDRINYSGNCTIDGPSGFTQQIVIPQHTADVRLGVDLGPYYYIAHYATNIAGSYRLTCGNYVANATLTVGGGQPTPGAAQITGVSLSVPDATGNPRGVQAKVSFSEGGSRCNFQVNWGDGQTQDSLVMSNNRRSGVNHTYGSDGTFQVGVSPGGSAGQGWSNCTGLANGSVTVGGAQPTQPTITSFKARWQRGDNDWVDSNDAVSGDANFAEANRPPAGSAITFIWTGTNLPQNGQACKVFKIPDNSVVGIVGWTEDLDNPNARSAIFGVMDSNQAPTTDTTYRLVCLRGDIGGEWLANSAILTVNPTSEQPTQVAQITGLTLAPLSGEAPLQVSGRATATAGNECYYQVDWGDNSTGVPIERIETSATEGAQLSHTYDNPGDYNVGVHGLTVASNAPGCGGSAEARVTVNAPQPRINTFTAIWTGHDLVNQGDPAVEVTANTEVTFEWATSASTTCQIWRQPVVNGQPGDWAVVTGSETTGISGSFRHTVTEAANYQLRCNDGQLQSQAISFSVGGVQPPPIAYPEFIRIDFPIDLDRWTESNPLRLNLNRGDVATIGFATQNAVSCEIQGGINGISLQFANNAGTLTVDTNQFAENLTYHRFDLVCTNADGISIRRPVEVFVHLGCAGDGYDFKFARNEWHIMTSPYNPAPGIDLTNLFQNIIVNLFAFNPAYNGTNDAYLGSNSPVIRGRGFWIALAGNAGETTERICYERVDRNSLNTSPVTLNTDQLGQSGIYMVANPFTEPAIKMENIEVNVAGHGFEKLPEAITAGRVDSVHLPNWPLMWSVPQEQGGGGGWYESYYSSQDVYPTQNASQEQIDHFQVFNAGIELPALHGMWILLPYSNQTFEVRINRPGTVQTQG